jgi:hypothetical protein
MAVVHIPNLEFIEEKASIGMEKVKRILL